MYIALESGGFDNLKRQHVGVFEDYPTYLNESQADIVDHIMSDIENENSGGYGYTEFVEYVICKLVPVSVSHTAVSPHTEVTEYRG